MQHAVRSFILSGFFFAVTVFLQETNVKAGGVPEMQWNKGAVVLADQQVVTGEFCVQVVYDLIFFKSGESVNVFPAHMVASLQVYDEQANINRKFVVQQSAARGFTEYHIYEVVVHGQMSLLRRQNALAANLNEMSDVYDFDYFVVMDGETCFLHQFREKVYPVMLKRCDSAVSGYVKDQKLNPNDASAAIQLIQYYNRHCATGEPAKDPSL